MGPDTTGGASPSTETDADTESAPNTVLNALIGAVVSVLLGFIPFSPVLGGGVAGYLEGEESRDGAKVGLIAGIFAAIPLVLLVIIGVAVVAFAPQGSAFGFAVLIGIIVVGVSFYTVVLSTVGGVLGVYIKNEI